MENYEVLLSEALEVETLDMSDELESFDSWDSLTALSVIALISEEYTVELTREEIENSRTIEGLKILIEDTIHIEV